jgi:hypothetical protein
MAKEEITLSKYKDVLKQVEGQECHLLLGNGFNLGLGVDTGYKAIFQKMAENNHGIYKEAENIAIESNYDLEQFIGKLVETIDNGNQFLRKYVANKIKFDFMKAAHEIVKSEIKNVYAKQNEGIFMLLKNFTNYFTLNYDTFLYLLLLNFKLDDNSEEKTIAIQPTLKFIEEDMNSTQNDIYSEIKKAREQGKLSINMGSDSNSLTTSMNVLTKTHFKNVITQYSKDQNKNWKSTDIERVVKSILEEEKKNRILEIVDDGSGIQSLFDDTKEFVFDVNRETQNLFFLHGAFHIYRDGKMEKKITQSSDKALYDRLEEILNNGEKDIICVFQSDNKIDEINKSEYLRNAYSKLSKLSGSMVIIGCSLSENDSHIYEQINKSGINTLYISATRGSKSKIKERAKKIFHSKKIVLFEAESISYELPVIEESEATFKKS